jgi:hypothetical protein
VRTSEHGGLEKFHVGIAHYLNEDAHENEKNRSTRKIAIRRKKVFLMSTRLKIAYGTNCFSIWLLYSAIFL